MAGDNIHIEGNVQGVGIAIGTGASVHIYGNIEYPRVLHAPLRKVFDPLIENRVRLFGGREAILKRIMERIQDHGGGYTVLTAPAGFGKTALIATLVNSTPDAFAYHFFAPLHGDKTLDESFFLKNTIQQMAEWHGHNEQLPNDINELRALYQQFLGKERKDTRILVLDGLDEVITWKLAPYLSRHLPERMHILLTLRDVGQNWRTEYQLPTDQVCHLVLDGLRREEIAQVLRSIGDSGDTFADNPVLLSEIDRIAAYQEDAAHGADPFYIRLLAEDIASGKLTTNNLSSQPSGLDNYLHDWWKELKPGPHEVSLRDLFGTLAAALGLIGRADLEAINPSLVDDWAKDFFIDVLGRVRRFVVGDDAHGYMLFHPRFQQYIRHEIALAPYEQKLLVYCADWANNCSQYALTYYLRHLANAGKSDILASTVKDLHFLTYKIFFCGVLATEADLLLVETVIDDSTVGLIRRKFALASHILYRCTTLADLATTLYNLFYPLDALAEPLAAFERTLQRPLLKPWRPLFGLPHSALIRTLVGHTGKIWGCALSADGATIVSASADETLKIWDAHTGSLCRTLIGHTGKVWSCTLSADGATIVSASADMTLKVWDAHTGNLRHTLVGHTDAVLACALSADGSTIASSSESGTVLVWDGKTGALHHTLSSHTHRVWGCALSADGTTIASASDDGLLKIWDADTGILRHTLVGHTGWVRGCALSADGTAVVSASADRTLRVWDTQTGILRHILIGHTNWVLACTLSANGTSIVSGSADGTLKLWDARTGILRDTLVGHGNEVLACALSADGTSIVSGSADGTLKLWSTQIDVPNYAASTASEKISSCAVSIDDTTVVSASEDGTLKMWNGRTGLLEHVKQGIKARACALNADGSIIVVASWDGTLTVWDKQSAALRYTLAQHEQEVHDCAVSADGHTIVSASWDKTLKVWNGNTGTLRHTLIGHTAWVRGCAISVDGSTIVSASDDTTLKVWDAHIGTLRHTLVGHADPIWSCALSTDGSTIVSASDDTTLKVWDAHTGTLRCTLAGHNDKVRGCALSADGRTIVSTALDGTLRLWDAKSSTCLAALHVDGALRSCALFSDEKRIVGAGDSGLYWIVVSN